jgi:uncharacterized protein (DUF58 family)
MKMFQIEPRVPVRFLIDSSISMSAVNPEKFDYARKLAGALAYVGLVRLDTLEIHNFAARLGHRIFCTGGRHRFNSVMDSLTSMQSEGRTDFFAVVREFVSSYSQRGMVIIISDFLDDQGCERPLQYLADFGHELLLIQVWAEEDRTPPWMGELELADAESGERIKMQVDQGSRERYTASFDLYAKGLAQLALRNAGKYVGVSTSMPIEDVIFSSLVRARGLG